MTSTPANHRSMGARDSHRVPWVVALGIFAVGTLLSGVVYAGLLRAEATRGEATQRRRVADQFATLQSHIRRYEDSLDSLRTLFEFSEVAVSRSAFRGGAQKLLERFPILQAVEWAPRIAGGERERVEAAVRAEGFPDFVFRDRESGDLVQLAPARAADEYVTVIFAEPLEANLPALGFNLLSGTAAPQLARARATGRTSMSQRVPLLLLHGSAPGFGVFLPVFEPANSPRGAARGEFRGVVLALFRLEDFLRAAKALPATTHWFDLLVVDRTDPEKPTTLGLVRSDGTVQLDGLAALVGFDSPAALRETLVIWGRTCEFVYLPSPEAIASGRTELPLAVLALGLITSAALGLVGVGRTKHAALATEQLRLVEIARRLQAEAERRQIFERITDAFAALDKNLCCTHLNAKASVIFGRRPEELVGQDVRTVLRESASQNFFHACQKAMTEQQPAFLEEYYPRNDCWLEQRLYPSPDGLSIYFHDITERKHGAALLSSQNQVLEMIATGVPMAETLATLLLRLEVIAPGLLGSILLLDGDGVHVRHGAAPSLPEAFNRAIDGQPIGPHAGSCGTAAFRREPVIVEDIATDPLWAEYKEAALAHGLRACWSTPIFGPEGAVLGTFAIYYRQPGRPTALHQRCIEIATQTAALAISSAQTGAALRESESRLRLSVTASNIGLWDWNLVTNEVFFSREWKAQLGYAEDEISNRFAEWESRVHPDDLAPTLAKVQRFIADPGADYTNEFRLRHKDGSWRWIFTQGRVFREASGQPIRVMGCHIDITARKQADEALRESEEKLRKVIDGLGASHFVGLLAPDGTLLEANQPALGAAGLRREDVLGQPVDQTYWFTYSAAVQEQLRAAIARGQAGAASRYDVQIRVADGRLVWLDFSLQPVRDADGRVIHLVPSGIVIEERKQGELKLVQLGDQLRALLARLQRTREEERIRVAREIHDELGQLLTGLKMDVRWLERKLSEPGVPAALRPLLARAVAASAMADNTIATVQRIALELRPGVLDHLGLTAALTQEARRWQERTGVLCTVVVAESWPALAQRIADELFYICQEALTNVARHAHARNVEIHLRTEGRAAVLEVSDDGVGLAEAELTAPRSLGLLGMKERAAQCGGTVAFEHHEPHGTRVIVRVPLKGDE